MATHITEAAAAADFSALLARAKAGEEIAIDTGEQDIVSIRLVPRTRGRLLSESLKIAQARTEERGFEAVMDADFAADVQERIRNRKPRDTSAWD